MSLRNCLPDLVSSGRVSKETADAVGEFFDELAKEYRGRFGEQAAEAMASEGALKALESQTKLKRRQQLSQIMAQERIRVGKPGTKLYERVETQRKVIRSQAFANMDAVLAHHRRNLLGEVRRKSDLENVTRELFGESTGDLNAKELADSFTKTAEMLRQRFNAAGGHIGKMDRWGLPQAHDSRLVRDVGYETWREFTLPKLDRERMVDELTGEPFTAAGLERAMREVYDTIRTDGWSKRNVGAAGRKSLANRHTETRFLHFASADDWLAYADRFGHGTPFDAMVGHVEAMSRDIAAMEMLGPDPTATVRWHKDLVEKEAALDTEPGSKGIETAHKQAKSFDRLWNEYSGANRRPESRTLALTFGTYRSLQTASKLGGAAISAVTDLAFQSATRRFNGMPAAKMLGDYLRFLNPANAEDRSFATRAGLIAETWTNIAGNAFRGENEAVAFEVSRRFADGVMRVSGLNAWTDAGRWAFGMSILERITAFRDKQFNALDKSLSSALLRNGIDENDWNIIRATPLTMHKGHGWIIPSEIKDDVVSDRLLAWILTETDFAVPTPDIRTRATINAIAPSGTWVGEAVKSAFQFKTFAIGMILMQGRRLFEVEGRWNRAKYAAEFFISTTLMGALALQLHEVAKGRDPQPMEKKEFWGAAILQGGGLGIFGDFLSSTENRFGGGIASTVAGPGFQFLGDAGNATLGNAFRAARGDETQFTKDSAALFGKSLPGSSLWYTRLALDRLVTDRINESIDPDYSNSWARMEKKASEKGQSYWWHPGDDAPERMPDFGNALAHEGAPEDFANYQ